MVINQSTYLSMEQIIVLYSAYLRTCVNILYFPFNNFAIRCFPIVFYYLKFKDRMLSLFLVFYECISKFTVKLVIDKDENFTSTLPGEEGI